MTDATNPPPPSRQRPAVFWLGLAVLAAVAVVYLMLVSPAGAPPGDDGPPIGRRLEHLHLEGLTGDTHDVSLADLEGRVTLLNYWGTWCPPCIREFPDIVELGEQFSPEKDFRLYAVSCGEQDDRGLGELRSETEAFLESRDAKLPTYADRGRESRQAMVASLGLAGMAYPTTVVLDRQGTIRWFFQGFDPRAKDKIAGIIKQLLAEPAPAAP